MPKVQKEWTALSVLSPPGLACKQASFLVLQHYGSGTAAGRQTPKILWKGKSSYQKNGGPKSVGGKSVTYFLFLLS